MEHFCKKQAKALAKGPAGIEMALLVYKLATLVHKERCDGTGLFEQRHWVQMSYAGWAKMCDYMNVSTMRARLSDLQAKTDSRGPVILHRREGPDGKQRSYWALVNEARTMAYFHMEDAAVDAVPDKKVREPKAFTPPTLSEVVDYYVDEKGADAHAAKICAENFIGYYGDLEAPWTTGQGKKRVGMTNWKGAATRFWNSDFAGQRKADPQSKPYTLNMTRDDD